MSSILLFALLVAQPAQSDAGPAEGDSAAKSQRVRVVEAPFEIHGCQMNHAHAKPDNDPDVIDIREVLDADGPLILPKTSRVRIGEAIWSPIAKAPNRKFKDGAYLWLSLKGTQTAGSEACHAIGQPLTYLERDSDGNLHIRRAMYRIPEDASPREGGGIQATFFAFFEGGEADEKEGAMPVLLFAKLLEGDQEVKEAFTPPHNDQEWADDEGLEFVSRATVGSDGKSVTLDPYCAKLVQVVKREKVAGVRLPVGKPTVVVDRIIVKLDLTPDTMALMHIPSEKQREGGHPLVLVVTAEVLEPAPAGH